MLHYLFVNIVLNVNNIRSLILVRCALQNVIFALYFIKMIKSGFLIPGDVLSFLAADNKYKAVLCTGIYNERSPHYYNFAATTYSSEVKPSLQDISQAGFYGVTTKNNEYFPYSELESENMWKVHPEIRPYVLGSYGFTI
jgi:hypothetical protein